LALFAAVQDEDVLLLAPIELVDALFVVRRQADQVLFEERMLSVVDEHHNVVIVANDQHDVLTKDSEAVLLTTETSQCVRNCHSALQLVPILHFDHDLEELRVEIALEDLLLALLLVAFAVFAFVGNFSIVFLVGDALFLEVVLEKGVINVVAFFHLLD
jgi:hypothetical protein